MRLFVYGTLLRPALLARLAGRPLTPQACCLPGWRRVRLHGTRYATLRRAPGHVAGAAVIANAATLRRLRAYEGESYQLCRVTLRARGRPLAAHAWIAPAATIRPWP
jgi:hypothetical protein